MKSGNQAGKRPIPVLSGALSAAAALSFMAGTPAEAVLRDSILIRAKQVPYFSNRPLAVRDTGIIRAVIVIHGSGRNVEDYFDSIVDNIPSNPDPSRDWRGKTIVVAPHFQDKSDAKDRKREAWWKDDWVPGGRSGGVSSYEVVDTLVSRLRNGTFPNLRWVVITGHSAGGQFVQRYAAFTDIDLRPGPNAALVKFVPSNPSSYLYLNGYRYDGAVNEWVIPHGHESKGYDRFKYGLKGLDHYAKQRGADWARTYLPKRQIELLAGTADVVADESFDASKEAMWQGRTRFQRGQLFAAFMDHFFSPNHFSITPVPGVGHDHRQIYASAEARNALYFPD